MACGLRWLWIVGRSVVVVGSDGGCLWVLMVVALDVGGRERKRGTAARG